MTIFREKDKDNEFMDDQDNDYEDKDIEYIDFPTRKFIQRYNMKYLVMDRESLCVPHGFGGELRQL